MNQAFAHGNEEWYVLWRHVLTSLHRSADMRIMKLIGKHMSRHNEVFDGWRDFIEKNFYYYPILEAEERFRFESKLTHIMTCKNFIAAAGADPEIDDCLTVAAHAALLAMNLEHSCFDRMTDIIFYPSAYSAKVSEVDEVGIVTEGTEVRVGESWSEDQIVLSLEDSRKTLPVPSGRDNVVIHELAHQLDASDGLINGVPLLSDNSDYRRWYEVFDPEFQDIQRRHHSENSWDEGVICSYGATDPAEFFAVVTEAFYLRPQKLFAEHKDLFLTLQDYFRFDPRRLNDME